MNTANAALTRAISKSGLGIGGMVWNMEAIYPDGSVERFPPMRNLLPQQYIDFLVTLVRGNGTPISNWYNGLYENNYVPVPGVKASDLQTVVGESQAYAAATRPLWNNDYDGTAVIDNIASPIEFQITQERTFYGSFLCSNNVKGSASGVLASIVRFSSPQSPPVGTVLRFAQGLTLIPTTLV